MSDDIKLPPLPEADYYLAYGKHWPSTDPITTMDGYSGDDMRFFARVAVVADRAQRASAADQVCYEAYQVVGSMLDDLGQFNTEQARKVLDNLSQAKKLHDDVLPWPSFETGARKPLTEDDLLAAIQSIGVNGVGRIALTCESGQYGVDRPTNVATLLCRANKKAGGLGKLVPCMKCAECGWSVTVGESK